MKFSVVTPTRNSLEKLKRCVGSVRGQIGADVEHIVQDACSDDGTPEWLGKQADLHYVSEADGGMYDAINRGWRRTGGDILSWLNSDEQYLPGTIALVRSFFEENPGVDFVYGNYIVVNGQGQPIAARREIRLSSRYIANGFLNAASCTLFFRRRLLESGELFFDDRYRYASDMDLILRLINSGATSRHLDVYLSLFAFDGENLSCSPKMMEETIEIRKKFGGALTRFGRFPAVAGRVLERVVRGCYFRDDLVYSYALSDRPDYRCVAARRVSCAYVTQ